MLINSSSQKLIDRVVQRPSHALMLASPDDEYNFEIAKNLAEAVLQTDITKYPYVRVILPDSKSLISIDAVRQISQFFKLKVPATSQPINRVCIIKTAQFMNNEAQTVLLKTLEELVSGSMIILCVSDASRLLPTVKSRCQSVNISLPTEAQLQEYYAKSGYSEAKVSKAYMRATGLPSLVDALLKQNDHPVNSTADQVKDFLVSPKFKRLQQVGGMKDKESCQQFLQMLLQIARIGIKKGSDKKWTRIYTQTFDAMQKINSNTQPKLVMTQLVLSI